MSDILIEANSFLSPYILDAPSAQRPYGDGVNDVPYGLWVCANGNQILHDRNYVPRWARKGDGFNAISVPLLPSGHGRWIQFNARGWFFIGGDYPGLRRRSRNKTKIGPMAHGKRILSDFQLGLPVWRYIALGDGIPIGIDRWIGRPMHARDI